MIDRLNYPSFKSKTKVMSASTTVELGVRQIDGRQIGRGTTNR